MKSVAGSLPALMRAVKVFKRAGQKDAGLPEIDCALQAWRETPCEEVLGTLLMTLAAQAGQNGIDPEISLNRTINDFIRRFEESESAK